VNPAGVHPVLILDRTGWSLWKRVSLKGRWPGIFGNSLLRMMKYTGLLESLERHRQIERNDGWKLFLPDTTLVKGIRHDDVVRLRERLDPFMEHHPGDTSTRNCLMIVSTSR
jgi:hypothetical protein